VESTHTERLGSSCVDGSVHFLLKYWFSSLSLGTLLFLSEHLPFLKLLVLQFAVNFKWTRVLCLNSVYCMTLEATEELVLQQYDTNVSLIALSVVMQHKL